MNIWESTIDVYEGSTRQHSSPNTEIKTYLLSQCIDIVLFVCIST